MRLTPIPQRNPKTPGGYSILTRTLPDTHHTVTKHSTRRVNGLVVKHEISNLY